MSCNIIHPDIRQTGYFMHGFQLFLIGLSYINFTLETLTQAIAIYWFERYYHRFLLSI